MRKFGLWVLMVALLLSVVESRVVGQQTTDNIEAVVYRYLPTNKDMLIVGAVCEPPLMPIDCELIAFKWIVDVATDWEMVPGTEEGTFILGNVGPWYSGGYVVDTETNGNAEVVEIGIDGTISLDGVPREGFDDVSCMVPQLKQQYLVRVRLVREVRNFLTGAQYTQLLYNDFPDCSGMCFTVRTPDVGGQGGGGGGQNGGME